MEIRVLGQVTVHVDGRPDTSLSPQSRRLLAMLAVAEGRPVSRDRLAEYGAASAMNGSNVRTAVTRLRKVLGTAIESVAGGYRLVLDVDHVLDAVAFREQLDRATRSEPELHRETLRAALGLWRGTAFGDFASEPWALAEARQLNELRVVAIEELAEALIEIGRPVEATTLLDTHADLFDYRERPVSLSMRAMAESGRRTEALRAFQRFRVLLRDEVGIEPTPQLRALEARVLSGDDDPDSGPTPTLHSGDALASQCTDQQSESRHNLPTQLSSFVGRARELSSVRDLLGASRLVTLTGAGGIGKTRLALKAAAERLQETGAVVRFANLGSLTHLDAVVAEIATSLGVGGALDRPLDEVFRPLREHEVLLVVDNCEQVLDSASRVIETVLATCPGVKVLATSRMPLGIGGEVLYRVPTMAVAAQEDDEADAVRLFYERGLGHCINFAIDDSTRASVVSICRRLDGLPLAIELATVRLRVMAVIEIERRLDDRFQLLTGGSGTAVPRHRTLKAMIDWSHELLTTDEATVFACLSVFNGGWTLDAAEWILRAACPQLANNLVGLHSSLVDKSLVQFDSSNDENRYVMLESIGAYARERRADLGVNVIDCLHDSHVHWYLALAERLHPDQKGPNRGRAVSVLAIEAENLYSALDRCIEVGDTESGLRLAVAFGWTRVRMDQRLDARVAAILSMPGDGLEYLRAKAHIGCVFHSMFRSSSRRRYHAEEAVKLARSSSDCRVLAEALAIMAEVCYFEGQINASGRSHDESLAVAEASGDLVSISSGQGGCAFYLAQQGRIDEATLMVDAAIKSAGQVGNLSQVAVFTHHKALIEFIDGNLDRATELIERALQLNGGDQSWAGYLQAVSHCLLAAVDVSRMNAHGALARLWDALEVGSLEGELEVVDFAIVGFAQAAAALGSFDCAAELLGLAARHRHDAFMARSEEPFCTIGSGTRETVTAAMPADDFERLYQRGYALSGESSVTSARRLVADLLWPAKSIG